MDLKSMTNLVVFFVIGKIYNAKKVAKSATGKNINFVRFIARISHHCECGSCYAV